ncbi:hypothetical protein [Nonomuraea sp. NPDC046570]|uniref:hypothetical protein n=1 Tax=Nonomuraea sp. NPDC046570 TaxID=3155255 RepID=UPI0033D4194A
MTTTPATSAADKPQATTPQPKAKKVVEPRPCLCGCGEQITSRKGIFRPGHDARHCSQLAKAVANKELTKAQALAQAGKASEALRNKLATMLDNAAQRAKAKAAAPKANENVAP